MRRRRSEMVISIRLAGEEEERTNVLGRSMSFVEPLLASLKITVIVVACLVLGLVYGGGEETLGQSIRVRNSCLGT